jgi:organic hydroperoxide reductase OsmC/OhrA
LSGPVIKVRVQITIKITKETTILLLNKKPVIQASSDPAFLGDPTKHNPEDLLVSSLSSCHMLWYLHFCSANHIIVEEYTDTAEGIMLEEQNGNGYFKEVTLNPLLLLKAAI